MKKYQVSSAGHIWQPCEVTASSELEGVKALSSQSLYFIKEGRQVKASWSRDVKGIWVTVAGRTYLFRDAQQAAAQVANEEEGDASLQSPMPAKVIEILVSEGDSVEEGQELVRLEAMKMEFVIKAPHAGTVSHLKVALDDQVESGVALVELEKAS